MSYVDGMYDRQKDRVHIVERVNGERVYREYAAHHMFYYDDKKGKHRTVYNTPVSRFSTKNAKEFHRELKIASSKKLWESDFKPMARCLEENYLGKKSPKLHAAYFDIETDFSQELGYAPTKDPFNAITAISVYLEWLDKLVTLVIPPKGYSWESASEICEQFSDCYLFKHEEDMLETFLDLIDDADVLSGWNSEGYDIPYTVNRIQRILSKNDLRRFCLWDQMPKLREFERFGAKNITFDLIGRVHLDYMQLYRKYTYEERHSYSLDAIGEYEDVGKKVPYKGTLDQLYNQDFPKFIDYNREDVMIIARLDAKLKFMDLANELAHENTVLLPSTMGAVAVTEQAIINQAHEYGLVVPDKQHGVETTQAAGAYVAHPRKGMHDWVGSVDINSLYPSAIRALNMGPETIIGQLRPVMTDHYIAEKMADKLVGKRMYKGSSFALAWEGVFGSLEYTSVMNAEQGTEIIIDWDQMRLTDPEVQTFTALSGEASTRHTAADIYKMIFEMNKPWVISANGTIFDYSKAAIVPGLLKRWYAERKVMQANKQNATTPEEIAFWDKRQLVKKINLNSLYGAILNPHCRFFDKRIGQSTTLSGRAITRHMSAFINEEIAGEYSHLGEAILYNDTDSAYFSAWPFIKDDVEKGNTEWNTDIAIAVYDNLADKVNASFPGFMEQAFHSPRSMGNVIKCGREIVASKSLFIKKKRYASLISDNEGKRYDVDGKAGKVKATGLDLKRSDTPPIVQNFLFELLTATLAGEDKDYLVTEIIKFKKEFKALPPWQKGTPKRVNNLTKYTAAEEAQGKANMPGHVRAAMNWNNLKRLHHDNYSTGIVDGMKTIVCKLKDNPLGLKSVGYPTDETNIPLWFKELPFDDDLMETTIVDQKVENLLGVLKWDISSETDIRSTFNTLFEVS